MVAGPEPGRLGSRVPALQLVIVIRLWRAPAAYENAALALFGEMPESMRWTAGVLGARVDLAAARTLRGDLAGAEDALAAVFALDAERRIEAVARRLTNLGRVLGTPRYRNAVEAARIGEAIEDFTAGCLLRGATRAIINTAG